VRIAIIAALPGELKPLVVGWHRKAGTPNGIALWSKTVGGYEWLALCGGMGQAAALRSFAAAEAVGAVDLVISAGIAGALEEQPKPGRCYQPAEVVDALTGERFSLAGGETDQRLVTTAIVADQTEKQRLRNAYGATLVDMEAAAIARIARTRNIPVYCFKAVSDGPSAQLPDLNRFIDPSGQMRMSAFVAYVLLRPRFWRSLVKLGLTSRRASVALARSIEEFLQENSKNTTVQELSKQSD